MIDELAEQQRLALLATKIRRAQRDFETTQLGVVVQVGNEPLVSIAQGSPVAAVNLGGALRVGDTVLATTNGSTYFVRGRESL